jgi:hypothetical protein
LIQATTTLTFTTLSYPAVYSHVLAVAACGRQGLIDRRHGGEIDMPLQYLQRVAQLG